MIRVGDINVYDIEEYIKLVGPDDGQRTSRRRASSRKAPPGVKVGAVIALGLADGRCPVGFVASISNGWLELDVMSWLTGMFNVRTEAIRIADVRAVVVAREMGEDEASSQGWCDDLRIFDTDPLGAFQTNWKREHQESGVE